VGDAVLREVVGADLFTAVSAADHRLALFGERVLLLLHLDFVKARTQHAHGFLAVLDLRFLVLAADNGISRNMRDAHGGVRRVHRLAAGPGRAERVDAQVFSFDFDVYVFSFGQNRHRDRRSVYAALLFRGGDALHAVHSALVFHLRVDALAFNNGDN